MNNIFYYKEAFVIAQTIIVKNSNENRKLMKHNRVSTLPRETL